MMTKCDCIDCSMVTTWKQAFTVDNKTVIINICKGHHDVLRFKVSSGQQLNEDVLKWLLVQSPNFRKAVKYDTYISLRNVAKKAVRKANIKKANEQTVEEKLLF